MALKKLKLDTKWTIVYDPDNNDKIVDVTRYGMSGYYNGVPNWVLAMWYSLLDWHKDRYE